MNKINKQRLIILSDLWGKEKSAWIAFYSSLLEDYFDINYYDSCDLGGIDKSDYSDLNLYNQFVNGGIDKAVKALLKEEKENCFVLGFSIGGYIAWKATNSGLKMQRLVAVSSTRLRIETQKPSGIIDLIYGDEDINQPDSSWFEKLELKANFINTKHTNCTENRKMQKGYVK